MSDKGHQNKNKSFCLADNTRYTVYKIYLNFGIYKICVCSHLLLERYFSIILTAFTH